MRKYDEIYEKKFVFFSTEKKIFLASLVIALFCRFSDQLDQFFFLSIFIFHSPVFSKRCTQKKARKKMLSEQLKIKFSQPASFYINRSAHNGTKISHSLFVFSCIYCLQFSSLILKFLSFLFFQFHTLIFEVLKWKFFQKYLVFFWF